MLTRYSEQELAHALAETSSEAGALAPDRLAALPKADVHCHALLNGPLAAFETVLGYRLTPPPPRFRDFGEFGGYLAANLFPATRTLAGVRILLRAGLDRMADEGIVYTEASIDLLMPVHTQSDPAAVVALVAEERERVAPRLRFVPEVGINRRMPPDRLWPLFLSFLDSGVFGSIDLYDDERAGDLRAFQRFFRLARDRGLTLKAHAGETCGAERIRETLDVLDVDVLQHGIAAAGDAKLLDELVRRGTQLNVGVASNVALGIAGGYESHPIRALLSAGVNVGLGTDDFTVFGTSLCDEIRRLRRAGLPVRELAKILLGPPQEQGP